MASVYFSLWKVGCKTRGVGGENGGSVLKVLNCLYGQTVELTTYTCNYLLQYLLWRSGKRKHLNAPVRKCIWYQLKLQKDIKHLQNIKVSDRHVTSTKHPNVRKTNPQNTKMSEGHIKSTKHQNVRHITSTKHWHVRKIYNIHKTSKCQKDVTFTKHQHVTETYNIHKTPKSQQDI